MADEFDNGQYPQPQATPPQQEPQGQFPPPQYQQQQYQQPYQQPHQQPYDQPQQAYPQPYQQYPAQYPPQPSQEEKPVGTSGLAIAGLVIGIVALLGSPIPIINNFSFFLGLIGLILAIAGLVGINKGKHTGRGIAIAGIIVGIISLVFVLLVQAACSAMLTDVSNNLNATANSENVQVSNSNSAQTAPQGTEQPQAPEGEKPQSSEQPQAPEGEQPQGTEQPPAAEGEQPQPQPQPEPQNPEPAAQNALNMSIGQTATTEKGLSVTVNGVDPNLTNFDGSNIVCANVTYVNNGTSTESFNPFDWKAEDPNGAQRSFTFFLDSENDLDSGQLAPGGTVSGNIYFDGPVAKIIYEGNIWTSEPTAAWIL